MTSTSARLDPRTHLFLALMGILALLFCRRLWLLLALAPILLGLLWALGPEGLPRTSLRLSLPVTLLVTVMGLLSFDLRTGLLLGFRLFDLLTFSSLAFSGLAPRALGHALRRMGVPYAWCFILVTGLRYVPLIRNRAGRIRDAQRSRGIDLRPRIGNLSPIMAFLIPLLVQSFALADELALAMEARGFRRHANLPPPKSRLRGWERACMGLCLLLLGGFLWWEWG